MAWVAAETQVQSLAQGTSHAPSAAEKKKGHYTFIALYRGMEPKYTYLRFKHLVNM